MNEKKFDITESQKIDITETFKEKVKKMKKLSA